MNAMTQCCPNCSQPYMSPGYYPGCGCGAPPQCNYPPPPPPSPAPIRGPILGITDGSNANPGEVGEFMTTQANFQYPAAPGSVPVSILSTLVLSPGDWDVQAALQTSTNTTTGAYFYLNPVPTGVSNPMYGWYGANTVSSEFAVVIGMSARANVIVPTLLAYQVGIGEPATAGTATLTVSARRRR